MGSYGKGQRHEMRGSNIEGWIGRKDTKVKSSNANRSYGAIDPSMRRPTAGNGWAVTPVRPR